MQMNIISRSYFMFEVFGTYTCPKYVHIENKMHVIYRAGENRQIDKIWKNEERYKATQDVVPIVRAKL